jgi:hypothetical protein
VYCCCVIISACGSWTKCFRLVICIVAIAHIWGLGH